MKASAIRNLRQMDWPKGFSPDEVTITFQNANGVIYDTLEESVKNMDTDSPAAKLFAQLFGNMISESLRRAEQNQ